MTYDVVQDVFFSVIVPTRNRFEQLSSLLSHLDKQTFADFEVIIVDDGSSKMVRDQYPGLLEKYGHQFRLILSGQNDELGRGASYSRNRGVAEAYGKYVTFIDDDDYWHDYSHLETASRILTKDINYDLYITNQRGIDTDGEVKISNWLYEVAPQLSSWQVLDNNIFHADKKAFLNSRDFFPHLNCFMCSKHFYKQLDGMRNEITHYEDMEFTIRAIDHAENIAFNNTVISTHNIPDRSKNESLSSCLDEAERQLKILGVANQLAVECNTTEGKMFGRSRANGALKGLALVVAAKGENRNAFGFALRALAGRPTVKWIAYCGLLAARAIFSRK